MEREAVMSGVDVVQGPRALHHIGVTVSGLKPGTEGDVIRREHWNAIHARRAEGASVSAIEIGDRPRFTDNGRDGRGVV